MPCKQVHADLRVLVPRPFSRSHAAVRFYSEVP